MTGQPVWDRPEPTRRPEPTALSRAAIVAAAVGLADESGLEAVSLRKVGAALDAGPMRLYRYVATKEELLDLVVDAVYAEMRLPEVGPDWRAEVHALADEMWAAAHDHPWFADLVGGRPNLGPSFLAYLEATLAALSRAPGLEADAAVVESGATLQAYLVGAIRRSVTERRAVTAGQDKRAWQIANGPYLRRLLDGGRYPTVARAMVGREVREPVEQYRAGLRQVLAGLTTR